MDGVVFLIIFLVIVAVVFGYRRLLRNASNAEVVAGGLPLTFQKSKTVIDGIDCEMIFDPETTGRYRRPSKLRLRINSPLGVALFLSPETQADRNLVARGFSEEITVGDKEVDRFFHIAGSDAAKISSFVRLERNKILLSSLAETSSFVSLQFGPQSSEIYFEAPSFGEHGFQHLVDQRQRHFVDLFKGAATAFGSAGNSDANQFAKRFILFDAKRLQLLDVLAVVVFVVSFLIFLSMRNSPLYTHDAVIIFGAVMLGFFFATLRALRSSIRKIGLPAKAFNRLFYTIGVIVTCAGMTALNMINMTLDSSSGETLNAIVLGKYIAQGRHQSYKVVLGGVRGEILPSPLDYVIYVDSSIYSSIRPGSSAASTKVHPGFFHIPWDEGFGFSP